MNVSEHQSRGTKIIRILVALAMAVPAYGWADVGPEVDQLVKENKELRELVMELTDKFDKLESRVSATERGAAPVSVPAPAEVEEGHGMLLSKGGNIYMDGFVDASFNWNFASPGTGPQAGPAPAGTNATGNSTLRAFDREADTFDLNSVQFNLYRPAPENGGVGFRTEFTYGTDAQVIESAGFLGGTDEFSIQEAFVDIKVPVGSGLTVMAGKFATLHGSEVIENFMNWNASRSLLFTNSIPFTHTGVRAMYNWLDGKVSAAVGLVNGWDNAIDNNKPKDIEAMVQWTPNENFWIRHNFLEGSQVADDRDRQRYMFDSVVFWKPLPQDLPKLSLMANYDYGLEERLGELPNPIATNPEGGPADWQGYALYAKYDLTDKLAVAARWEQFWDDQGVRTAGLVDDMWEMTYTLEYKFWQNLLGRLEYRHDEVSNVNDVVSYRANPQTNVFDNGTDDSQDTIGASLIYLFG